MPFGFWNCFKESILGISSKQVDQYQQVSFRGKETSLTSAVRNRMLTRASSMAVLSSGDSKTAPGLDHSICTVSMSESVQPVVTMGAQKAQRPLKG